MSEFGNFLKMNRNKKRISLAKVSEITGITDSRLSKAENGADETLSPVELKKLASVYNISVVSIYIEAGYLEPSDLEEYQSGFMGTHLLDAEEKAHIQDEIDFINRKRVLQS